jgi:hypothetical protein
MANSTTYYAVCNAGGPISVKLDGSTEAEALAAFAALDGRAAIDGQSCEAERDLGIEGADQMGESAFAEAMEAAGAEHVRGLEPVVNAHAGTVADLVDGWALWAVGEDAAHGYTFAAWLSAAGRCDSASEYDLRSAWRAGEDPSEYAQGDR